jgi:hypothetical protein
MGIWCSSWYFGIFFPFWYFAPRKIWQPCTWQQKVFKTSISKHWRNASLSYLWNRNLIKNWFPNY